MKSLLARLALMLILIYLFIGAMALLILAASLFGSFGK